MTDLLSYVLKVQLENTSRFLCRLADDHLRHDGGLNGQRPSRFDDGANTQLLCPSATEDDAVLLTKKHDWGVTPTDRPGPTPCADQVQTSSAKVQHATQVAPVTGEPEHSSATSRSKRGLSAHWPATSIAAENYEVAKSLAREPAG